MPEAEEWNVATQGLPPLGLVMGPHPPCDHCGSDGYPADLEIALGPRTAHLCIECWHSPAIPERLRQAFPATKAECHRLRTQRWSRSWRGWPRQDRAPGPPELQVVQP